MKYLQRVIDEYRNLVDEEVIVACIRGGCSLIQKYKYNDGPGFPVFDGIKSPAMDFAYAILKDLDLEEKKEGTVPGTN